MSEDQQVLFVGGPYDGKRQKWTAPTLVAKVLTMTLEAPLEDVYTLCKFQGRNRMHQIAVHEGVHDPMLWLIEGYKK